MHYRILFLETDECPLVLNEEWTNGWNEWVENKPNSFSSIEDIRKISRYRDKCLIGIVDIHGKNIDPPKISEIATYFLNLESDRRCKEDDLQKGLKDYHGEHFKNTVNGIIFSKIRHIRERMACGVVNVWEAVDFTEFKFDQDCPVPEWNPREPEKFQQYNPLANQPS